MCRRAAHAQLHLVLGAHPLKSARFDFVRQLPPRRKVRQILNGGGSDIRQGLDVGGIYETQRGGAIG